MRESWRVPLAGHWVGTMRCMACGAEMILLKVIADETMPVPGFQRHAYMCSLCHDTEQRLFFNEVIAQMVRSVPGCEDSAQRRAFRGHDRAIINHADGRSGDIVGPPRR